MAFKLTIADIVEVPVKLTINDGNRSVMHGFSLRAKRMDQQALREVLQDGTRLTRDVLQDQLVGWSGQRLVVDADSGEPAPFSTEALDCLLSLPGAESIVLGAYLTALMAADGSAGRGKN